MHEFLQMLQTEHEEVQGILAKLQDQSPGAVKTRQDLFMKLKRELVPHMKGEQKAMEAMEEHHVAEPVLKELETLSRQENAKNWKAKVKVFAEILGHHIEEEESEVFPAAQELLEDNELSHIMDSYQKEKDRVLKGLQ